MKSLNHYLKEVNKSIFITKLPNEYVQRSILPLFSFISLFSSPFLRRKKKRGRGVSKKRDLTRWPKGCYKCSIIISIIIIILCLFLILWFRHADGTKRLEGEVTAYTPGDWPPTQGFHCCRELFTGNFWHKKAWQSHSEPGILIVSWVWLETNDW